jgi:hypothetical protein
MDILIEDGIMQLTSFLKDILLLFSFLGILFIPVDYALIPFQNRVGLFFGASSDTIEMVYFIAVLLLLACVFAFFIPKTRKVQVQNLVFTGIYWYLSLQLMRYGANKLFKHQFYLPEPNTLFTRVGNLDRDILYWTSMGTSYEYNVFMGIVEILPAVLLLIPRFRFAGLLVSVGVLSNVLAVNIGFDITVKCFSAFLLFLSVFGLFPYKNKIKFLFGYQPEEMESQQLKSAKSTGSLLNRFIPIFAVLFIFAETLYPYVLSGNFNDDLAPRPFLHGVYKSVEPITHPKQLAYVFIHRRGYLIFQNASEVQIDYQFQLFPKQYLLMLTDYKQRKKFVPFRYDLKRKRLILNVGKGEMMEFERLVFHSNNNQ